MLGFNRCLKVLVPLVVVSLFSGCSYLVGKDGLVHDSQHDYREAKVLPEISVPDQYDKPQTQDLYAIPGLNPTLQLPGEFKAPRPEIFVNSSKSEVRLYKDGNKYWLSTSLPPADTWSRMRRFWEIHEIDFENERPEQGVFESKWLSRKKDGVDTVDKFRVRVEHGMLRNSSEVYLMHLEYPASETLPTENEIDWSQTKDGDELVETVIQEMGTYLIQTGYDSAPTSLLAQRFKGKPKSSLSTDEEGNEFLKLKVDLSRAWIVVGKAIEDAKLEKANEDPEKGIYYIDFHPKKSPSVLKGGLSIFSKISTVSDTKEVADGDFKVGKIGKGNAHRIALKLSAEPEQVIVRAVGDKKDTEQYITNELIEKIRENLI